MTIRDVPGLANRIAIIRTCSNQRCGWEWYEPNGERVRKCVMCRSAPKPYGQLELEAKRKHEATHGWRNPPSVYEEDRSDT